MEHGGDLPASKAPLNGEEERKQLWSEVDPPRPKRSACAAAGNVAMHVATIAAMGLLPWVDDSLRGDPGAWGFAPTRIAGLPQIYGLVIVCCVLLPWAVVQVYIGFVVTHRARTSFNYYNPVHYASVDIHVEDVLQHGAVLSGGDEALARTMLDRATKYSCLQRTHGNSLETYPNVLVLGLIGGLEFPLTASVWGGLWSLSRVVWTWGYSSGVPISRYRNPLGVLHWDAIVGLLVAAIMVVIRLLQGASA